jgi:hypothetical protein
MCRIRRWRGLIQCLDSLWLQLGFVEVVGCLRGFGFVMVIVRVCRGGRLFESFVFGGVKGRLCSVLMRFV